MQDAKNFDTFSFYAMDDDERASTNYQFPGADYTALAAHQRVLGQPVCLSLDLLINFYSGSGIVLRDVIQLTEPALGGAPEPVNDQAFTFSRKLDLLNHAARLVTLLRFTSF